MSMHSEQDPPAELGPQEWQGRFSDGQTARSEMVMVRLTQRGLQVNSAGEPQVFAYATLSAASPLTGNSLDVLLSFAERPGATLFVSGEDFARLLAEQAPNLTASAERWKITRPILVVVALVAALVATLWVLDVSPAKSVANLMPDNMRQSLGDSVVASMVGNRKECTAPAGRAALDRMIARLSKAADSPRQFSVRVVEWKLINAFATPGERIVLTSEIIAKANGPDEIAGVLAHEMGHGIELHPEAGVIRAIGLTAAMELFFGGGTISNLGLALAQIQYTRAGEREADLHALRILKNAGISTAGLVAFFERLAGMEDRKAKGKSVSGDKTAKDAKDGSIAKEEKPATKDETSSARREALALFRTHPGSDERAKLAAAQSGYPTTPSLSAPDWQALRTICTR